MGKTFCQIREITLLNPYHPHSFQEDKFGVLEMKARGKDRRWFHIELKIKDEADYDQQAVYSWARLSTEQLQRSDDCFLLSKGIGIHVLNFTSIVSTNTYHHVFQIQEKESKAPLFPDLELHAIELEKFYREGIEELRVLIEKIKTSLDLWLAFLTRYDLLSQDQLPPALKKA
ncbi:MAG: PD-(D/E)XK nuclease family transposase [Candidatus Rhabdochlamydia sp.]